MPTPIRIIIDIKDADTFNWEEAHRLWKANFHVSSQGFGSTCGYGWYKADPTSGAPLTPLTESTRRYLINGTGVVDTDELKEQIDALASAVYKMKRDMQNGITPEPSRVAAIENTIRKTYSRWAEIPESAEGIEDIAEVAKPKRTRAKKPVLESAEQAFMRYLDGASARAAASQISVDTRRVV